MSVTSFIPLAERARWAMLLLAVTIGVNVVAIGCDIWEIGLIGDFLNGRDTDTVALASSDDRQSLLALLEFVVLVATGIVFIRWFHAAYKNTAVLTDSELRFKPGWAIGAWFVPVLNLWRPKQIADDIWRASDAGAPALEGAAAQQAKATGILTLWWALWLISGFMGNFTSRFVFGADTLNDVRDSDKLDIAALTVGIAAAVLAIIVIRTITDGQLAGRQPTLHSPA